MYADAFVGSSMENGTTMILFDLRKHALHRGLGTPATLAWGTEAYHVDVHELSTFHHPITSRCIVTQGSYVDAQNHRRYFTPEIQGGSTSQHVSHSVVRFAGSLAGVCGVSLRPSALLFAALLLLPTTKSSIKRWMEAIGAPWPTPEAMLQQWLARTLATECPIDGYSPRGTDHWVLVVQDAQDRILMTHAAPAENGEDARPFLPR